MDAQRWRQIEEIYHSALSRPPERRVGFLKEVCRGDGDLLQRVQSLLTAGEQARGFLEIPALVDASTAEASPTDIGSYRILYRLGAGGMGEVFRAHDSKLGRDVAIKMLPREFADDPQRLSRLRREARTLASVNHPNIAAIYDLLEAEGKSCLVLELVEGETLRGPLPIEKALDYARQIAEGLAAAHHKGIIHRDLKPANVKVTPEGRVKVLDFGLAKAIWGGADDSEGFSHSSAMGGASATLTGQVLGTPPYMSPEQARGIQIDKRTDIWAFGCLLYELLTGALAFKGNDVPDIVASVLTGEPDWAALPPETPAKIRELLQRCLQKDPEKRPQEMTGLVETIDDAIAARRGFKRWQIVAMTAAALVAIAAVVIWMRRPVRVADRAEWAQLTHFADAVSQPALSPDGRMLTFIRGEQTFSGPGQVYVKVMPAGDAVQLTHDDVDKMSPAFSPDGSRIAYTTVSGSEWDTWIVSTSGGQPHAFMPNASGLSWIDRQDILFSEVKHDIHMALVKAKESRAEERDVYLPSSDRGMVHRSYPSPDRKWVLAVEMDRGVWLPCRLVPMDGSTSGRPVGPLQAGCTSAAWSPDGQWMYLNSAAGGTYHIWRQRFPDGEPEQLTSGPTEEEGIAPDPDGRSLITAVGLRESSVWIHDSSGERQVSLEGYSFRPKFTADGKHLCYQFVTGALTTTAPSELRIVDLQTGRNEALLPGFTLHGILRGFDLSPDSRLVVAAVRDAAGKSRLWVAPLDRSKPPQQIPGVEGDNPRFGESNDILFRGFEGTAAYIYRVHIDGRGLRRVLDQPIAGIRSVSPDGQWLVARVAGSGGTVEAVPLGGGAPITLREGGPDVFVQWPSDEQSVFIGEKLTFDTPESRVTYVVPVAPRRLFPRISASGLRESDLAGLPGVRVIHSTGVTPGPTADVYAFVRESVERNLYRVPLR